MDYRAAALWIPNGRIGCRSEHIKSDYWMKWETSEFRVEADWSETRRSRVLPIRINAMEWLKIAFDLRKRDERSLPNHNTFTHRFVAWGDDN